MVSGSGISGGGAGGAWTKIQTVECTGQDPIDFTGLSSSYKMYMIMFLGVRSGRKIKLLTSSDGGSTFDSGASDYRYDGQHYSGGVETLLSATTTSYEITTGATSTTDSHGGFFGTVMICNHADERFTIIQSEVTMIEGATDAKRIVQGGARLDASVVDAIRLESDGAPGLFDSGEVVLYGLA